ncbi:AfsR/SARP family transcriptional regulator [Kribbella sp. CA-253562]|uniref:AfsR/SARP family transcriptional regulator n=1 Tax=Kribbella sp. CA-253562 TaxID=3239942 RepID=UPI003D8BCFD5
MSDARTVELQLLQGFVLSVGRRPVCLISSAQRVLAFLALQERQVARGQIAALLWPEATASRAHASLRSAIWRAQRECDRLIHVNSDTLALSREVMVDVRVAASQAHRILAGGPVDRRVSTRLHLSVDLLPDWYDDWVVVEREQYHQLRLHALEALCERLTSAGRIGEAVDVGLDAIRAEPLRESAHRVLIEAHLAGGNRWEALRQFQRCKALLAEELGLEPSAALVRLVRQTGARVALHSSFSAARQDSRKARTASAAVSTSLK